jgi:hypothetical protein
MNTESVSLSGGGLEGPATGQNAGDWFESIDTSALQENQRLALWSLLKAGSGVKAAAAAAGVAIATLRLWMDEDRRFIAAIEQARERIIASREAYSSGNWMGGNVPERVLMFLGIV